MMQVVVHYVFEYIIVVLFLITILAMLLGVAYFTLYERKIIASMQMRRGPNVIFFLGLGQPLMDGLKLFLKEVILPSRSSLGIFLLAPVITFSLALTAWSIIPFAPGAVLVDSPVGLLIVFAFSTLGVYGLILAGWSSNSKYPFLASLRAVSQMISYEVSIGLILISVLICTGSMNLSYIVTQQQYGWFIIPLLIPAGMFLVSALAETGRTPFDLPEAEPELVSGFNVEYSGMTFALFFLGENSNMILMASLISVFFLGGWATPVDIPLLSQIFFFIPQGFWLGIKVILLLFLFVWVRVTLPRYNYSQLMKLGWKSFLPLSLAYVIWNSSYLIAVSGLPL